MIPLRDVIPTRTSPSVTLAVIAANVLVFVFQLSLDERRLADLMLSFGLVPAAFLPLTLFTSMFLHTGFLPAAINMLCLWIFGGTVEDRMGHGRFLVFYVVCGVAAAVAQRIAAPDLPFPLVGASGAVAGVMGAYFVLYPRSRVVTVVPLPFFLQIVEVPAFVLVGAWLIVQLVHGVGLQVTMTGSLGAASVALWAHAAGLIVGASGVLLLRRPERQRVEWWNELRSRR